MNAQTINKVSHSSAKFDVIPLSLYIHIPWCIRKCPYCDFNSHALRSELPEQQYITRLLTDLQEHLSQVQERSIASIFIGGGTPSLFSATAYEQLFQGLKSYLNIPADIEVTLEANPGSSEQQRFVAYRQIGINRLSIGVQSFYESQLKALGRVHNQQQALSAINAVKAAGFTNYNIDLMFGLPQQSIAEALQDLAQAIVFNPPHLSWYQLTLEPNTYFAKYPPRLPASDLIWEMQAQGQKLLIDAEYQNYEVSAYCRGTQYSRHNLNYWLFGDYIGIGAGSHSKITDLKTGIITRSVKLKNPKNYLDSAQSGVSECRLVKPNELALEFMMNALRLKQAIPLELFYTRTGLSDADIAMQFDRAQQANLLELKDNNLVVTPFGQRFLNELLEIFLPEGG